MQRRQTDDVAAEMWRRTDSDLDLQCGAEEEEDETDGKYSSDIMLCVNQAMRTNEAS